jgi:hypothetical protein
MSLINDALKQAKQAQQEAAPPPMPNLQLRPIEAAQYTRPAGGVMWPAALVAIALLLLVIVWQQAHRTTPAQPAEVKARPAMPATPTSAQQPAPPVVAPAPVVQSRPEPAPSPVPAPTAGSTDVVQIAAGPLTIDRTTAINPDDGIPNPPAATEAPAPKPALPKLQAIVFVPIRPSVMISGRTLFIGDKLDGLRVAAIDRESVTLVGAGQTNVLTLPE